MSTNDPQDELDAIHAGQGSLDPAASAAVAGDVEEAIDDEPQAENAIELREVEGLSQGQIVRRRFFRHTGAMIGLVVVILIALLAISSIGFTLGPVTLPGWWKYGYNQLNDVVNPRGRPR